ncbi:MAG: type B DNA-directed DNA polymerase [Candidatus Nanohaloarchaea archaeon]
MVFKIDFRNGKAFLWSRQGEEVVRKVDESYSPRFYIGGSSKDLLELRAWLSRKRGVESTCFEEWFTSLEDREKSKVVRVDVSRPDRVSKIAHRIISGFPRQKFRFYNVSLSRQFRYCLQNRIEPVPDDLSRLEEMRLSLHRKSIADSDLSGLRVDGEKVAGSGREVLELLVSELEQKDPDILYVSRGQLLPLIEEKIREYGLDYSFGRLEGFEKLASENTVQSYGKTVHSSARFNVPGRIVIDESNSFLLGEATVEGLWDLVRRSWKPLQELAWGSIGRLLTAIEIRKAYLEKDTLTSWKNWSGENFKSMETLHDADRGGYIFNPEPGIHENVFEADFASLFPSIMVEKNISPETVCCDCCDNSRVPELDYSICEQSQGFISEVLAPLVDDRQEMKERVEEIENKEERKYVQGSIDAIKWLLVSCFGYMGHAHASYGAIECHQAIQAFDRKIMSKTADIFDENGYGIVHGIVDSLWVQGREGANPISEVRREISDEIGIKLELEHEFEWVAFVPRASKEASIGTLNRYFGRKKGGGIKTAGIEVEQHSACDYVKECQMEMIERYDEKRSVEEVLELLESCIEKLESGGVDPSDLIIEKNVSKKLEQYQVKNRNYSALKRAEINGLDVRPGQKVRYVVREDDAEPGDRVRLEFETEGRYDPDFYVTKLIRAAESILSPMGLDRNEIRERVEGPEEVSLRSSWYCKD